ncbi:hypothetical protein B5V03_00045 [Bradyrhizobium betae]|uniref:Uncharacterized protein n=1 Tax=Bradyrhizobium betae TaxID=244734 RepID=A0A4Q1VSD1_9BRAD|nr:hypothetical protein B5V03_00045 [Bradyrhizobium betae]
MPGPSQALSRNVAAPAALIAMSEADFVRYAQQAQACLDEAGKATREGDKEAWLKLGEEWMEMARKARREKPSEH